MITSLYKPLNFKHKYTQIWCFLLYQARQSTTILICYRRKMFFKATSSRLQIRVIFSYSRVLPSAAFPLCSVPNSISEGMRWRDYYKNNLFMTSRKWNNLGLNVCQHMSFSLVPDTTTFKVVLQCVKWKGIKGNIVCHWGSREELACIRFYFVIFLFNY